VNEEDVVSQMVQAGLDTPPSPLKLNGKRVYFGPKKKQWYRLHEIRARVSDSEVVVGDFGDFKHGVYCKVDIDWKGMAAEERERLKEKRQQQEERQKQERAAAAAQAAMTAAELWTSAAREPLGPVPYLQRKAVQAEGCRYLRDGSIVIPLLRYDLPRDQALKALQVIRPDGTKRFTKGFEKPGCSLRLGHVVVGEPLLICEGWATGLSLRMALERKLPVFVGLDAGNLLPVAQLLRGLYPQSPLLICADDDWRTEGNPGRHKAHLTAKAVAECAYTWPVFQRHLRGPKDTDFNDLALRQGLNAVRQQIRQVLPFIGSEILNAA
jgi:putative DNA primase/helicase